MATRKRQVLLLLPLVAVLPLLFMPSHAAADSFPWMRYLGYADKWFDSFEARRIGDNVISHQSPAGSWPKDIDTGAKK